jgi:tetratricopeptide (TPR) repeat protein
VLFKWKATRDFHSLARFYVAHPHDLQVGHMVGWCHWLRSQALPEGRDEPELRSAVTALTPCFLAAVDPLPSSLIPLLAEAAMPQALDLLQWQRSPTEVTMAVQAWERIVEGSPPDHPLQAVMVSNLGLALRSRYQITGETADLDRAIGLDRLAVEAVSDGHPDRAGMLSNLGLSLRFRYERTGDHADADEAVDAGQRAVEALSEGDSNRGGMLSNLSESLRLRFKETREVSDLEEAVAAGRRALQSVPEGHPSQSSILSNLILSLRLFFEHTQNRADLDEALTLGRRALVLMPEGSPGHADILANLSIALYTGSEHTSDHNLADEAIQLNRQSVQATSSKPDKQAKRLSLLGRALHARFKRAHNPEDLNESIGSFREAIKTHPTDHVFQTHLYSSLKLALYDRFQFTGNRDDLDQAINATRLALKLAVGGPPERAEYMCDLGVVLRARFDFTGDRTELDEAVDLGRRAVELTPVDDSSIAVRLSSLGLALHTRFESFGGSADLHEAVDTLRKAVRSAPELGHDLSGNLSNLALALRARFEFTGERADLDEAIAIGRRALDTTPQGHHTRPSMLSNLGLALQCRFELTSDRSDTDEAVELGRLALEATPSDDPRRFGRSSNLAGALRIRFELTGDRSDLDQAVEISGRSADGTHEGHPLQADYLSNLATVLRTRFDLTGDRDDLDQAVTVAERAVQTVTTDHPRRGHHLSNLSAVLQRRFEHTGGHADLGEAIKVARQAVKATPEESPVHAGLLSNLSLALQRRFEHTGGHADTDEAVAVARQAVKATPEGNSDRAKRMCNLALVLQARFQFTNDPMDRTSAIDALSNAWADRLAAPSVRIQAGRTLAELVGDTDPNRCAEVLQEAVGLLPQVASRRLGRTDQQHMVGQFPGLAGQAAAAVLSHPGLDERERAVRALAVVEAGRGVLLSQALDTRTELTDLQQTAPDLAIEYTWLRDHLDRPISNEPILMGSERAPRTSVAFDHSGPYSAVTAQDQTIRDRHRLVGEFDAVVEQIRALEGFATFGMPPSARELLKEAGEGPVVVFTTALERCDALLLTATGVSHLGLPDLIWEVLVARVNAFRLAQAQARSTAKSGEDEDPQQVLTDILGWLWDKVAGPVLDALGFDTEPVEDEWPRVWWSPGGLLGQLPLHAAGHHDDPPGARRTVMDRVISSYTPTVRALRYAREQAARHEHGAEAEEGALVVAMPTTPGQGALPFVAAEAEKIRHHVPNAVVLAEPGTVPASTGADALAMPIRARVLELLPQAAIAHFACHGHTDPGDPSRSRLLLHDHAEDPLTVAALGSVRLDRARLAYLSACSTASITNVELLDEAIHVASAFQLAGLPHVVGTLWEVNDQVSATVADLFYTHLRAKGEQTIEPTQAAHALHAAVRAVRDGSDLQAILPGWDRIAAPLLWAPYLHTGA